VGERNNEQRTSARKIDIYLGYFANVPMEVATCSIMSIVNISNLGFVWCSRSTPLLGVHDTFSWAGADGRLEEGQQIRDIRMVVFLYKKTGQCDNKSGINPLKRWKDVFRMVFSVQVWKLNQIGIKGCNVNSETSLRGVMWTSLLSALFWQTGALEPFFEPQKISNLKALK
jgi:hypothetical protein